MKENKKGEGVSNPGPTQEVRNKKLKNVKEPPKAKITDLKKVSNSIYFLFTTLAVILQLF